MIRDVVEEMRRSLQSGRSLTYCRLVETRGSTPQKAGAIMLVYADGTQAGTLGGGCVEAEVKRKALAVLASGQSELATFQLDSDYGWDDGLICGGRMRTLLVPFATSSVDGYFSRFTMMLEQGRGLTEAVVFGPNTGQLAAGTSFLFDEHDELIERFGDSSDVDISFVRKGLRPLSTRPRPYAVHGVGYLPLQPRCRLLIVGAGHVGLAVANLASDLDFAVWVVDDREELVSEARFPRAEKRICGDIESTLPSLEITPDTYCLIVTRGHNHDEEALYHLVDRGARYVGLIGSRRKIKMIFDDLLAEGISPQSLESVHAPLGIDIGSQSVMEIAISICAEIVSHRNRDGVVPGRPAAVEVCGGNDAHGPLDMDD